MKKTIYYLTFTSILLFFNSCGPTLTPFTNNLYKERNWSDNELKRVQFYLSRDIVMYRQLKGSKFEVVSGEVKIVDGRKVDEITIRKGTPGILLFRPKDNRFAISFEEGNDNRYLIFGPSPKAGGKFVLLASDWNRNKGAVSYEDKKYTVEASSAYAALMIDLKKIRKTSVKSRTAKGRKVDS